MLRTKAEGERLELTSAPAFRTRLLALVFLAVGVFGLGWLVTTLGHSQVRHFTCDRASGSCAVQSGDDVVLLKLGNVKVVTVTEHQVHGLWHDARLLVVLDDGSNRTIGQDAINGDTIDDYKRAAGEIRAFLEGNAPASKVAYTYRASLIESWPAIAVTGSGFLLGLWMLAGWKRRHLVVDKPGGHVTWAYGGPLRWSRQRRVPFAEVRGVHRKRRRLDLVLVNGKRLRIAEGDELGDAERAVAALLPKPAPPPPPVEKKKDAKDDKKAETKKDVKDVKDEKKVEASDKLEKAQKR